MATIPASNTLPSSAVKLINSIRSNGTASYQNYVPEITADQDSVREVGRIIMSMPQLQNEFVSALLNRIGFEVITSKVFRNKWEILKRGTMDMGETIEEIFVNIATAYGYDPIEAEKDIFKRTDPDIRSAFHNHNFYGKWKGTIYTWQLKKAFLSINGVMDLISAVINSMYSSLNLTEFHAMKYAIGRHILNGYLYPMTTPTVSAENARSIVTSIKGYSNLLELTPSTLYNPAGVENDTPKEDQILIVNTQFDAMIDVEVLALAFNMSKAEFMAKRILIDGFGNVDADKLKDPDGNNIIGGFVAFTEAEKTALNAIPAILVDKNKFMHYDVETVMLDIQNPSGNWWNYFLHARKIISISPFANGLVLTSGTPGITSVTVTPETISTIKGTTTMFEAEVVAVNWAMKSVSWSVTGNAKEETQISRFGTLYIAPDETATTLTITATSLYDNTKTDTATVTIS